MKTALKVNYCTEDKKVKMLTRIQELHLTYLFCYPMNKSGWVRYRFSDGLTGETLADLLPILN